MQLRQQVTRLEESKNTLAKEHALMTVQVTELQESLNDAQSRLEKVVLISVHTCVDVTLQLTQELTTERKQHAELQTAHAKCEQLAQSQEVIVRDLTEAR